MMNDTVREDLQTKISTGPIPRFEAKATPLPERRPVPPRPATTPPVVVRKHITAGLVSQKTSPTLVEFQNKNASLPDWRIQLQNAVQQRKGGHTEAAVTAAANNAGNQFPNNRVATLKAEIVPRTLPEITAEISDPRVASAMRRIAASRNTFLETDVKPKKPAPMRPFGVVSPNNNGSAAATAPARVDAAPKPKLVSPPPQAEKRSTNKLPPIETPPETAIMTAKPVISRVEKIESGSLPTEFPEIKRIQIKTESAEIDNFETQEIEKDEIEDLAPFSMRFGAGLFDLIIGGFISMLLLLPLAFTSGNWFTTTGLLTIAATWALVTFLYMTACLGFFGKTMGMRLFVLELVDAVDNEYPTLRQAAVNSSVFIVMLAFAGAGFLTVFFNEENRALHDLLSGTILVREF